MLDEAVDTVAKPFEAAADRPFTGGKPMSLQLQHSEATLVLLACDGQSLDSPSFGRFAYSVDE